MGGNRGSFLASNGGLTTAHPPRPSSWRCPSEHRALRRSVGGGEGGGHSWKLPGLTFQQTRDTPAAARCQRPASLILPVHTPPPTALPSCPQPPACTAQPPGCPLWSRRSRQQSFPTTKRREHPCEFLIRQRPSPLAAPSASRILRPY